ncbi:hypothetical protein A2645_00575 [Candidatus Nomurabacteria bacterium RIFCSPHIGHO2_01_FULL_39_9]|uniref:Uncharacterized protein n=1 Tax=Candidatus Nomurabacteria bacterium RIFCSPHIGHO2_01_FULL_39_9 TaxID=1801735 RepID=A0A1F6UWV0_9BACT|nr:MAG: hypothetical protein A2645_00575 [Candidatus Nomurabacteria bacterium RIFCSPHIGHO2_01_FULL_39_9]
MDKINHINNLCSTFKFSEHEKIAMLEIKILQEELFSYTQNINRKINEHKSRIVTAIVHILINSLRENEKAKRAAKLLDPVIWDQINGLLSFPNSSINYPGQAYSFNGGSYFELKIKELKQVGYVKPIDFVNEVNFVWKKAQKEKSLVELYAIDDKFDGLNSVGGNGILWAFHLVSSK